MIIKRVLIYALSLLLAFGSLTSLAPSALAAQGSNTGRLVGSVTNPQGEIVVGATVVVTDNATGKEQTITTSGEGTFALPQLEVGTYTVKVTAQGFKTFTANGVKIDLGREYSLNVPLEIGGVTENVTVTAGADLLNATTAELSSSISMKEVRELPLNGRNPIGLITTQAGTSSNGAQNTAVNGQRSSFTNITRDGINIQDNFIRANAVDFVPDRPNVDDVGEITITTQNAGAELGAGASQIQLVTPRGSNAFHGSAFIYNRNSELSANTFFNNASDVPRPFLNRNQFGGRLGGPVVREKLFFFFAYEGFRQRSSAAATRTILLPSARQGIFTFTDNTGARRSVNLFSLLPSSAGITGIDPLVQSRILDQMPTAGNTTSAGDQLNTTGFQLSRLQNQDRDGYTTRIDYEINQNNSLNGVYSYKKEFLLRPDIDLNTGGTATTGFTTTPFGNQFAHTHFLALAYRMNPTARITNEIRGGYQKSDPTFDRTNQPEDFFLSIPL
ncbi:MAG TPA: carboxypeptidase-like regulatory domain-containing protein, partial [Blastocatellia bacterium]|nr:carboxypeptidase-like regulatory domain-containing protein [Blastocatellia bacterium]